MWDLMQREMEFVVTLVGEIEIEVNNKDFGSQCTHMKVQMVIPFPMA